MNPHGTYPDFFGTSSFVTPGSNTMLRMYLEKTFTTDASLAMDPNKRQCFTKDELVLKNFETYSQQNCLIDGYMEAVKEKCGCVGRHRGITARCISKPLCVIMVSYLTGTKLNYSVETCTYIYRFWW